jgi:hypothetical protein
MIRYPFGQKPLVIGICDTGIIDADALSAIAVLIISPFLAVLAISCMPHEDRVCRDHHVDHYILQSRLTQNLRKYSDRSQCVEKIGHYRRIPPSMRRLVPVKMAFRSLSPHSANPWYGVRRFRCCHGPNPEHSETHPRMMAAADAGVEPSVRIGMP